MNLNRQALLSDMAALGRRDIHCGNCLGECCTAKSNSMQITGPEADDILEDLETRDLLTPAMVGKIRQTIQDYRLEVEIPAFGSRPNLRRTYTCPFYSPGAKGCLISAEKKPLGCLAFNPIRTGATGLASGCRSDQRRLSECTPDGLKLPIPVALWRRLEERGLGV